MIVVGGNGCGGSFDQGTRQQQGKVAALRLRANLLTEMGKAFDLISPAMSVDFPGFEVASYNWRLPVPHTYKERSSRNFPEHLQVGRNAQAFLIAREGQMAMIEDASSKDQSVSWQLGMVFIDLTVATAATTQINAGGPSLPRAMLDVYTVPDVAAAIVNQDVHKKTFNQYRRVHAEDEVIRFGERNALQPDDVSAFINYKMSGVTKAVGDVVTHSIQEWILPSQHVPSRIQRAVNCAASMFVEEDLTMPLNRNAVCSPSPDRGRRNLGHLRPVG